MNINTSRHDEFKRVLGWFKSKPESGGVDIYGISGFGGMGKSYLLTQAISDKKPSTKGYLQITIDGADKSILGDFMAIYERCLCPKSIPNGLPKKDYFSRSRKLVRKHSELTREVEAAFKESSSPESVKNTASLLFRGGALLNQCFPKIKEFVDFEAAQKMGFDKQIDEATDLLRSLKPFQKKSIVPGFLKDILGITYEERVKNDLYRLAADEWVSDIGNLLIRDARENGLKRPRGNPTSPNRLLLIIDDFEILGKTIVEFLQIALIPSLENSDFHSTIIILGRDSISDSSFDFQHHFGHLIRDSFRIERFKKSVAMNLFEQSGYKNTEHSKLWEESQGLPFLVSLICQGKGGTVSFYQQFYDRVTKWMATVEKDWVLPLCYLDKITAASVPAVLPKADPNVVMEWLKNESSLRDPNEKFYVIAPYIRRTLKEHHKLIIGSAEYEEWERKGLEASKLA
jgi:hypothetical protein